jgi:hypothetical protein
MTVNEHLLGFIAMAIAILAILTVGTLIAADIIYLGPRRTAPVPEAGRSTLPATERSDPAPAPAPVRQGGAEDRHPSNAA